MGVLVAHSHLIVPLPLGPAFTLYHPTPAMTPLLSLLDILYQEARLLHAPVNSLGLASPRGGREGQLPPRDSKKVAKYNATVLYLQQALKILIALPCTTCTLSPRKPAPRVASLHECTLLIQRISCGVAAINDGQRFLSDFFIQPSFTYDGWLATVSDAPLSLHL
ncbi:hypothetical protein EVAR_77497_1 [Eumeta japonica]|uniref:Uncharacterized protein n=1 Tax=Eumeta variegata TaxID=151549 RepID=A0A4C1T9T5_EUMVA|nr:hypothetical protein EVAR_77497_1 [Eumeta japonica]